MKINNYGSFPEGVSCEYCKISELDEYDLELLDRHYLDEVWYWYACGRYEGMGDMLIRRGDKYYLHDMGHCSCYGPTEHIKFNDPYSSLDEIKERCSAEEYKNVEPLAEMARGKN